MGKIVLLFVLASAVWAAALPKVAPILADQDKPILEITVTAALIDDAETFDTRVLITGEISAGGAPVPGAKVTAHHKDADGPLLGEATTDAASQFEILAIGWEDWPLHTHPGAVLSSPLPVYALDPVLIMAFGWGFQPAEHVVQLRAGTVPFREGSQGDSRSCTDGLDNDGDGSVDSEDGDCAPFRLNGDWLGAAAEGAAEGAVIVLIGLVAAIVVGVVVLAGGWYLMRRSRLSSRR